MTLLDFARLNAGMHQVHPNYTAPAINGALTGVAITIVSPSAAPLAVGVDESYSIRVPGAGTITLQAQTVWGAMYGLEVRAAAVVCMTTNPRE